MKKTYDIKLSGVKIGTTDFEFADTPMGVVHGKINFENVKSPYELNYYRLKTDRFEVRLKPTKVNQPW